jgi:AraC-like DNA-binding protein
VQYLVHRPGPPLCDFVDYFWSLRDAPSHARERIVPSGTIELVINLAENEFRIYGRDTQADVCRRFPGAIVSGCYRVPFGIDTREHTSLVGVHFRPGGASGLLGAPPGEIADAHVALEGLWGPRARELRERLGTAPDSPARFDILERVLVGRVPVRRGGRSAVKAALRALECPRVEIGEIAKNLGLSRRRLIEIFAEDVGMTPKRYARVRRFQRALAHAKTRPARWAELALQCGYFDQAHLCREWAELTGLSPAELVALLRTPVKENHVAIPEEGVTFVQYASVLRS